MYRVLATSFSERIQLLSLDLESGSRAEDKVTLPTQNFVIILYLILLRIRYWYSFYCNGFLILSSIFF